MLRISCIGIDFYSLSLHYSTLLLIMSLLDILPVAVCVHFCSLCYPNNLQAMFRFSLPAIFSKFPCIQNTTWGHYSTNLLPDTFHAYFPFVLVSVSVSFMVHSNHFHLFRPLFPRVIEEREREVQLTITSHLLMTHSSVPSVEISLNPHVHSIDWTTSCSELSIFRDFFSIYDLQHVS